MPSRHVNEVWLDEDTGASFHPLQVRVRKVLKLVRRWESCSFAWDGEEWFHLLQTERSQDGG